MAGNLLIDVAGSAKDRARSYGERAAGKIRAGVGHYMAQLDGLGISESGLEDLARSYLPIIDRFDAGYVMEMREIAAGADVSLAHIVLINARTELLKIAGNPKVSARLARTDPDGCTAVVAAAPATADGRVIHGHNWDWKAECAETSVVLRVRRDDGPDYLTFTEAGALARFGLNEAGLAIAANYLECERDYRDVGVPLALIRRKVLDQTHMAMAVHTVCTTPKSGSNNIVLSDREGMVLDFECAPDESFLVEPDRGLLVHANHWVSPAAQSKLRNAGVSAFPCSFQRHARARALLQGKIGSIGIDDIRRTLLDDYGSPWSLCRPLRPSAFSNLSATVASLVMEPDSGRMAVAILPAQDARFTTYSLSGAPVEEDI
jgi:isopenicillin-N N-acyltransferase like protein